MDSGLFETYLILDEDMRKRSSTAPAQDSKSMFCSQRGGASQAAGA